ncbi:hypothetical protein TELCIR_26341, partial [Teladorsagia circumcincta]
PPTGPQAHGNPNAGYPGYASYGSQIRFVAKKKDTAMAELGTPTAVRSSNVIKVDNAMKYLEGITLFGLTLQFKRSMQTAVKDVA